MVLNAKPRRVRVPMVVGLAVALALMAAGCDSNPSPSVAPSPAASSAASPPSAAPSDVPASWRAFFDKEDVKIGNVIAGPDGFLVAGCRTDADGNCERRIVLSSPDGAGWTTSELDVTGDLIAPYIRIAGDRLFVLGYGPLGDSGGAIVSTSLDGRSWTQVESASFRERAVDDVIESPFGTIAVGFEAPFESDNSSGFVVWSVADDGSFGEVRIVDSGGARGVVGSARWTGTEFLAWMHPNGPRGGPTILSSADGLAWGARATFPSPGASDFSDLVAIDDRLVAVGPEGSEFPLTFPLTARAWVSDDAGRTWTASTIDGTDAWIRDVDLVGGRLVAIGSGSWGPDSRPVTWVSADGIAWTRSRDGAEMPDVAGFVPLSRAVIGERICVSGAIEEASARRAAIYCR